MIHGIKRYVVLTTVYPMSNGTRERPRYDLIDRHEDGTVLCSYYSRAYAMTTAKHLNDYHATANQWVEFHNVRANHATRNPS